MVTGITRYALTSMDSGPNHLNDISLDPRFDGLCGFTIDEFDTLFADRFEGTLSALKEEELMEPAAGCDDLRAKILNWYDGYNWGGKNRVLNPYSILHFFDNNNFDNYWVQSGRPGHLTALIQDRPQDFLEPTLKTYVSAELRKSDLNNLAAVPVLFHSGYLTVEKKSLVSKKMSSAGKSDKIYSYSFRIPNLEVDSSYYNDCFSIIFNTVSGEDLETKGEELKRAFLTKDEQTVAAIFTHLFSAVTYHQRPKDEKTFHAFVHLILRTMGFKVLSEIPGSIGRLDLCFELKTGTYIIIELKYCPYINKLTEDEKNMALAKKAIVTLSRPIRNKTLAQAIINKLNYV
jgi:hypothetical protein